jgi:hypothetical protein
MATGSMLGEERTGTVPRLAFVAHGITIMVTSKSCGKFR